MKKFVIPILLRILAVPTLFIIAIILDYFLFSPKGKNPALIETEYATAILMFAIILILFSFFFIDIIINSRQQKYFLVIFDGTFMIAILMYYLIGFGFTSFYEIFETEKEKELSLDSSKFYKYADGFHISDIITINENMKIKNDTIYIFNEPKAVIDKHENRLFSDNILWIKDLNSENIGRYVEK